MACLVENGNVKVGVMWREKHDQNFFSKGNVGDLPAFRTMDEVENY
jgi:hypothetical protein